jgi:hypothetical protein
VQRGRNPSGPIALKGFAEKLPAWQMLGAGAAESRFEALRAATTPLVGRRPLHGTGPRHAWRGGRQPLPKDCFGRGCLLSTAAASLYRGGQFPRNTPERERVVRAATLSWISLSTSVRITL